VISVGNVVVVVHGPSPISTLTTVTASHYYLPTISCQRTNSPFQSRISSPTFDMSDQSGSSHSHVLFKAALEDYKQQTGIELAKHPLAERLQDYYPVESVIVILRGQAQDFKNLKFREKDEVLKPLRRILIVLRKLSSAANSAQDVGMVCPRHRRGAQRL
jgi:hypothetical protein